MPLPYKLFPKQIYNLLYINLFIYHLYTVLALAIIKNRAMEHISDSAGILQ
jgi:hypothetical protein